MTRKWMPSDYRYRTRDSMPRNPTDFERFMGVKIDPYHEFLIKRELGSLLRREKIYREQVKK